MQRKISSIGSDVIDLRHECRSECAFKADQRLNRVRIWQMRIDQRKDKFLSTLILKINVAQILPVRRPLDLLRRGFGPVPLNIRRTVRIGNEVLKRCEQMRAE